MKIAHISDLHLDANHKRENLLKTQRLIEHISAMGYDHVILTGDITENAEDSAFELARKLFKKHGLLDPNKLTVTIGNHDIYGGVHLAEDVLNFPAKCRAVDFDEKVKKFCHYFREAFENTIKPADDRFFPFVKELDEVVFVGLNSIAEYSALKNPFASNGKISKRQFYEVHKMLVGINTRGKKILALTHHHFCKDSLDMTSSSGSIWQAIEKQTMKLKNKKRVIKGLKKAGAELVLHGHLHESTSYNRKGVRFLNAGGTILGQDKDQIKFNDIDVHSDKLSCRIVTIDSAISTFSRSNTVQHSIFPYQYRTPARNVICMN